MSSVRERQPYHESRAFLLSSIRVVLGQGSCHSEPPHLPPPSYIFVSSVAAGTTDIYISHLFHLSPLLLLSPFPSSSPGLLFLCGRWRVSMKKTELLRGGKSHLPRTDMEEFLQRNPSSVRTMSVPTLIPLTGSLASKARATARRALPSH